MRLWTPFVDCSHISPHLLMLQVKANIGSPCQPVWAPDVVEIALPLAVTAQLVQFAAELVDNATQGHKEVL